MRVSELIDILRDQDPESEVELAIVAPVDDDSDDISLDRYTVAAVLPWEADDEARTTKATRATTVRRSCGWSAARTTTSRRSSMPSRPTTTSTTHDHDGGDGHDHSHA